MKRRDLVKRLEKAGFKLVRHGSDHDILKEGLTKNKFQDIEKLMKN